MAIAALYFTLQTDRARSPFYLRRINLGIRGQRYSHWSQKEKLAVEA
ncbi:MAG: hypothetical protein F6J93_40460 [Oscillatoria sp. SIO1A7]|nr:hypothetical protein [Oscillatoria sp. SIO1A7]